MKMFKLCVSSMMVIVLISMAAGQSSAQNEKIDGQIDIVAAMAAGLTWENVALQDAYIEFFRDHFIIGEDKVRLALTQWPGSYPDFPPDDKVGEKIVLNLTADFDLFKNKTKSYVATLAYGPTGGDYVGGFLHYTFRAIDEIIFAGDNTRAKIVILGCMMGTNWKGKAYEMAEKLRREKGILIYVSVTNNSYYEGSIIMAQTIVGKDDTHRIVVIDGASKEDYLGGLMKMKSQIIRDLCGWKAICRYYDDSKGECKQDQWLLSEVHISDKKRCQEAKPVISCIKNETNDDCRETCDEKWPWQHPVGKVDCTQKCGPITRRVDREPDGGWKQREVLKTHCDKDFACPPCPTPAPPPPVEVIKNLTAQVDNTLAETSKMADDIIAIIGGVTGAVIGIALLAAVALVVFIRMHNSEKKVDKEKMDAVLETVSHMSVYMGRLGGAAGTAAELPSVQESMTGKGPAKKMDAPKVLKKPKDTPKSPKRK